MSYVLDGIETTFTVTKGNANMKEGRVATYLVICLCGWEHDRALPVERPGVRFHYMNCPQAKP